MKQLFHLVLTTFTVLLSSCAAPNFSRQWEKALDEQKATPDTITGPWEGRWTSGYNKHSGQLRCVVTELSEEDHYHFLYWATWGKLMRGTFVFEGEGHPEGEVVKVSGKKKIGIMTYNHNAEITPTSFDATFGSDVKDYGNMKLSRPE